MVEGQEGVTWLEWMEIASTCERYGFDGLFRSDHYQSLRANVSSGSLDAWTVIAALATQTKQIRLGTLVSPVTFRHPAVLAKSVAAVDHISGGRVEVGLGAGWYEREHSTFGIAFPSNSKRLDILSEQVEIICRLLDRHETQVTFHGTYYHLEECEALPVPLQDPRPPLILGGQAGPRASRLAARWANEYNVLFWGSTACREARHRLDDACNEVGRDPSTLTMSLMTGAVIGTTTHEVELQVRSLMDYAGESGSVAAYTEYLRGRGWIVGQTNEVLEQLALLANAGVTRVMLQMAPYNYVENIELLGSEIVTEAATTY
ncbi:MAG: TIGR03560 family F420-dependent LLM class oxidoreductase [Actinobacteria bacterium]|nr:TIGR03560 family F420-dependent LLM class oxidoreductase [Actinomycetota bacterium]